VDCATIVPLESLAAADARSASSMMLYLSNVERVSHPHNFCTPYQSM
jgi:hypothetical protein